MLIDTHAHVQFSAFKDEYREVLARAREAGVLVVNVGTQQDTSRQAVKLAEEWNEQIKQLTIDNSRLTGEQSKGQSLIVNSQLFAVVGLHPVHTYSQHVDEEESHFTTREEHFDSSMYRSLAQNPLVVGIGECGLDYYRLPDAKGTPLQAKGTPLLTIEEIKHLQKEAFIAQIRLAKELDKALVIHCRPSAGSQDAYEDILAILDQELQISKDKSSAYAKASADLRQISNTTPSRSDRDTPTILGGEAPQKSEDEMRSSPPKLGGVPSQTGGGGIRFEIHSFTGTPDVVQEFLKRGAYVGLNGIITFDKTGNMEQVVKAVPLDHIVLETDAPYLAPIPYRGKKNEPAYVSYVAQKVAEIKDLLPDEVAVQTTQNACRLFRLRPGSFHSAG